MPTATHTRNPLLPSTPTKPRTVILAALKFALVALVLTITQAKAADTPSFTPKQIQFFETKIRPLLSEHCFDCHNAQKQKGGLLLTSRTQILQGGESGPAAVPGSPDTSALIEAVRYKNSDFQMPPKKRLSDNQIHALETWVAAGLPWPTESPASSAPQSALTHEFAITEKDRAYWAFQPVERPPLPDLQSTDPPASPIDHFVLARLQSAGLSPNPAADRRTLARRAYYDLIGLPPTHKEIQAFVTDERPDAYSRLIESLLSNPAYGERWGRHWLDVVRFAQTNGYERDDEKPLAWKYRDYVIDSFNQDKPYDQFVREQLAGDELDQVTRESLIATGFFRLGVWDDEPDDRRAAEFDGLDDMLKTMGETFLGLTIGCARCHNHMFDPISQREYYQLLSFFRNVAYYDRPKQSHDSATYIPLVQPHVLKKWQGELQEKKQSRDTLRTAVLKTARKAWITEQQAKLTTDQQTALALPAEQRSPQQQQLAEAVNQTLNPKDEDLIKNLPEDQRRDLERLEKDAAEFEATPPWDKNDYALAVREASPQAPSTHLLIRGNAGRPGERVSPVYPSIFEHCALDSPTIQAQTLTTGRRRALAEWITQPKHPLTARVLVNRVWQHHFGRGLVATPNDFGRSGIPPSHPQLLDWLASEFVRNDWSIKHLHRTIMMSRTYQQRSTSQAKNAAADPGNQLLWRQNLRRLEAESLRDSILAVAGKLNPTMGGRGFFPILSGEVVAGGSRPGRGWGYSPPADRHRRSVYTFIKRTMGVPLLEVFDYNNTEGSIGARTTTTVAPQALTLLNDEFVAQQAQHFADTLWQSHGWHPDALIQTAFQKVLGRQPSDRERTVAHQFLNDQAADQERIKAQLIFRPDVPGSLERGYLTNLPKERFLIPPNPDWQSYKGRWGNEYEGILVADPDHGPFTLWQPHSFGPVTITGELWIDAATKRSSLLVQAHPNKDTLSGFECLMDQENGRVSLIRHQEDRTILSQLDVTLTPNTWIPFRLSVTSGSITVDFPKHQHQLHIQDATAGASKGAFGLRSWGGGTRLKDIHLRAPDLDLRLTSNPLRSHTEKTHTQRKALREFCSLLFNLNEFAYLD